MSIQDVGAIGELIGSLAIFVTLVYLAIQTRLNRIALAAGAHGELLRAFSAVNQNIINSSELALIYERGLRDPSSLSKDQAIRFFMLVREAMNGYFGLYGHYRAGTIDEHAWKSMGFELFAACPGVVSFMETHRQWTFNDSFISYFDGIDKTKYDDPVLAYLGVGSAETPSRITPS